MKLQLVRFDWGWPRRHASRCPTICRRVVMPLRAPFRKYLNVFIDPTCGWLRTVAQMRGLAYRSIPFRQAGDAAAYLAGPTDLPPSRRSVSFPDHAPLPTPPPPATHGPFPRAAP
jgi:hypothetical protein